MSLIITAETCINCGFCAPECPNDAITEISDANPPVHTIRTDWCTECVGFHEESQCQAVCPINGCIITDPDHPQPGPGNPAKLKEQTDDTSNQGFDF